MMGDFDMKTAYEYNKDLLKKVVPSMAYDGKDYENWKIAARAKLSELLGMEKFAKVEPEFSIEYEQKIEGATEVRFSYQSEEGYRVPCHLLLPDGIVNPPVMICIQGHSTGAHISLGRTKFHGDEELISGGDRDFCVRAIKEGFACIAMEQRNFGECGAKENGQPGCFDSAMTALLMGRTTIGERVWDISRLIDVIETEFKDKVDIDKICCMGNSGGGTATSYAAALEDRLALVMPSCAMCAFTESIGLMPHCACNYVPNIANYFDMGDLMAMAYPKKFIQVSGIKDWGFHIAGSLDVYEKGSRVYKEHGKENDCTLVQGPEGHRFYADLAWPHVKEMLK